MTPRVTVPVCSGRLLICFPAAQTPDTSPVTERRSRIVTATESGSDGKSQRPWSDWVCHNVGHCNAYNSIGPGYRPVVIFHPKGGLEDWACQIVVVGFF